MTRILVHLATGPENPTRGALAFRLARMAVEQGHEVTMFIAGDGVAYLREPTMEAAHGIGTGNVREHFEVLVGSGARLYASLISSGTRGLDPASAPKGVELVLPDRLVDLVVEAERVVSY